ncbi:aspartate/glutamate racemase family protein [bacterium]|nr:aspartate/glutamate racemase family protein [bacterium]
MVRRNRSTVSAVAALGLFICSCGWKSRGDQSVFIDTVLKDKKSFFYIDAKQYPVDNARLPIGVFDSGTGGLTVLEQIVTFDAFNNDTRLYNRNGDGKPDFSHEHFIYLGDQANMPYGNYSRENNVPLLKEHILKDVQFLLGNRYYGDPADEVYKDDKMPVKAIVIACNTATAFGKRDIESFIDRAGLDLKVIGVIDAGVRAALELFQKTEGGSIAVMATVGTVASDGYTEAIRAQIASDGFTGNISVYQQAGLGLAGAIDGSSEYISDKTQPRAEYRGPAFDNADADIERPLLSRYGFDWENNNMLYSGSRDNPQEVQLNSIENYISYHLVSLLEKMRLNNERNPLKVLILGCTHYPYFTHVFEEKLEQLCNYSENGSCVYRKYVSPEIVLIDPASYTAKELYEYLKEKELFGSFTSMAGDFFISVPNRFNSDVQLDSSGNFTYDYKYGRDAGIMQEYVKRVPFSTETITPGTRERLERGVPETFRLINGFDN